MNNRAPLAFAIALGAVLGALLDAAPTRAQDTPPEVPPAAGPDVAPATATPAASDAAVDAAVDAGTPRRRKKKAETPDAGPVGTSAPTGTKSTPATPAAPEVPPEVLAKAQKLASDLRDALLKEPGSARDLEGLALSQPGDAVLNAEPTLKALLKIARARALMLQNRLDEATTVGNEARGLVDAVTGRGQKALIGQLRYRQAEIEEAKMKGSVTSCGPLGLRRLSALEGKQSRARVEQIAARYKHAVNAGERFWSRRAAYRTARAYDELYRKALQAPATYRGIGLPAPLSISRVDTATVLSTVLGGAWPAEISRLYSEVLASIDARDPDPWLLEHVREHSAAFARLTQPEGERAENPWLADEKPGLVRHHRQWQKKQADGSWTPLGDAEGKAAADAALKMPPTSIEHAYALVSLAGVNKPAPADLVIAALKHDDPRVRLAGLLAAERRPGAAMYEPIVAAFNDAKEKGAPFSTLQGSLFGQRERSLLALRALANEDRSISEKILADDKLPVRERAWVIAELGEARLQYNLPSYIWDKDQQAGATALYALVVAVGPKASGYMRTSDPGLIGCVSKSLQDSMPAPTK